MARHRAQTSKVQGTVRNARAVNDLLVRVFVGVKVAFMERPLESVMIIGTIWFLLFIMVRSGR